MDLLYTSGLGLVYRQVIRKSSSPVVQSRPKYVIKLAAHFAAALIWMLHDGWIRYKNGLTV